MRRTSGALDQSGDLQVWFKGGTSLSKGFGLIHRFSEDLDLRIDSAAAVRCVHPRVTLLEKLDAIAARFEKNREPSEYVRHYEDAARIIEAEASLPILPELLEDTAKQMAPSLRLARVASASHPALSERAPNEADLQQAYAAIAPMFWAPRVSLEDARSAIRDWLGRHFE